MSTGGSRGELAKALVGLHKRLVAAAPPLRVGATVEAAQLRDEMVGQLADYVLPRLAHREAPLVAVVGGSTGTGKSTLVNSLIGRQVSAPGVLRPTTRSAVVAHHPDDAGWFSGGHILPGLTRTTTGNAEPGTLRLVADTAVPKGLALVDTPDIDSVVTSNRDLASQLLSAADLWMFVTSGTRYADAVPWGYLRDAADRSAAVAVVLDRVDPAGSDEIRKHLAQMLSRRGLGEAPLFVVPETTPTKQGLLPADDIETVKLWLAKLAGDPAVRAAVVQQTLDGMVRSFVDRVPRYADALDAQLAAAERLRTQTARCYRETTDALTRTSRDGSMLRGEVLARWHEFVGTGEIVRSLETRINQLHERAGGSGGQAPGDNLAAALEQGFEAIVVNAADHAAESVDRLWRQELLGQTLLTNRTGLSRAATDVPGQARAQFRAWAGHLSDLIAEEGERRRATARLLSFGAGGLGLVLAIAAFTVDQQPDAPPVGTEANGATAVKPDHATDARRLAHRVLEAVFGPDTVTALLTQANDDLRERVSAIMMAGRTRYDVLIDTLGPGTGEVTELRQAVRTVEALR